MIWKFSDAYALTIVAPLTVLLIAAIATGPCWTVLMLAGSLAGTCAIWWWLSRPDWPRRGR